ncbi:MAG: tail fiber domain-containing protein [Pseudomonadaceae bacterium]|nr:tail fiber domain-containing protein [Pseudomonadaceae bacterium]
MTCRALLVAFALLLGQQAYAACSSPAGNEGEIRYATNFATFAYCNGTDWISMAGWVNSSGGGASLLNELTDVDTSGASTGKILAYNGTTWVVSDSTVSDARIGTITDTKWCVGASGQIVCSTDAPLTAASLLGDLANVDTTGAATGDFLKFDGSSWVPSSTLGGLNDLSDVDTSGASTGSILAYDGSGWVISSSVSTESDPQVGAVTGTFCQANGTTIECDKNAATQRTALGLGTTDSPTFAGVTAANVTATTALSAAALCDENGANCVAVGDIGTSSALPDRISSSNSQAMVRTFDGGTVSFTTGGVGGTSYLDTTGRWIGPGISITTAHGVSSTNGYFSGKVGIGTTNPGAKLEVDATASIGTNINTDTASVFIRPTSGATNSSVQLKLSSVGSAPSNLSGAGIEVIQSSVDYRSLMKIVFSADNMSASDQGFALDAFRPGGAKATVLRVLGNGNVGISTTTPLAKLDVNGTISASSAIQVGDTSLTCGAGIPGAIKYTGGAMYYCNGSAWTAFAAGGSTAWGSLTGVPAAITSLSSVAPSAVNDIIYFDGTDYQTASATTLLGLGPTDRISSSNSQAMVRTFDGGTVSFTTGGVGGTSYLDTTGRWIGPGISITTAHGVSSTNGYFSGNVGIGTADPSRTLDVNGKAVFRDTMYLEKSGGSGAASFNMTNGAGTDTWTLINGSDGGFTISGDNFNDALWLEADTPSHRIHATTAGAVGISNATPLATLDVAGTISASSAIQVGDTSLTCGAGIPGAIKYTGGSLYLCDGSSWAALGTGGGGSSAVSPTGAIQFSADGAGAFGGDATNLYWDNANKRLGIGTASPSFQLDISASAPRTSISYGLATQYAEHLFRDQAGNSKWSIGVYGDSHASYPNMFYVYQYRDQADSVVNAARLAIKDNGNIGIGMAPSYALDVNGTVRATAYLHSSDARLKDNITTIGDTRPLLQAIDAKRFTWKSDGTPAYGFIAQEVEKAIPEAVPPTDGMKAVDYDQMVPILWAAVKDLQAEVATLKAQLEQQQKH